MNKNNIHKKNLANGAKNALIIQSIPKAKRRGVRCALCDVHCAVYCVHCVLLSTHYSVCSIHAGGIITREKNKRK